LLNKDRLTAKSITFQKKTLLSSNTPAFACKGLLFKSWRFLETKWKHYLVLNVVTDRLVVELCTTLAPLHFIIYFYFNNDLLHTASYNLTYLRSPSLQVSQLYIEDISLAFHAC
jgi:hypothetical protein